MQDKEQKPEDIRPLGSRMPVGVVWAIALAAVLLVALLVAAILGSKALDTAQQVVATPQRVAEGLGKIFESKVVIENDSLVVTDRPIAELAVTERRIMTTTKYETSFLGVRATAIIKGSYLVKAGYDLSKPYSFRLDAASRVLQAQLPEAEILSIQTENQEIFYLSENVINSIDPEEWEQAYRENRLAAEREADSLGILEEARERFLQRASDLLGAGGIQVEMPVLEAERF